MHVFEPPLLPIPGYAERTLDLYEAEWREPLRRVLETEWCAALRESGIENETLLVDGPVGETLAGIAENRHAQALVIGTRGFVHSLAPRGVVNNVLRHARQPVVMVPQVD